MLAFGSPQKKCSENTYIQEREAVTKIYSYTDKKKLKSFIMVIFLQNLKKKKHKTAHKAVISKSREVN